MKLAKRWVGMIGMLSVMGMSAWAGNGVPQSVYCTGQVGPKKIAVDLTHLQMTEIPQGTLTVLQWYGKPQAEVLAVSSLNGVMYTSENSVTGRAFRTESDIQAQWLSGSAISLQGRITKFVPYYLGGYDQIEYSDIDFQFDRLTKVGSVQFRRETLTNDGTTFVRVVHNPLSLDLKCEVK